MSSKAMKADIAGQNDDRIKALDRGGQTDLLAEAENRAKLDAGPKVPYWQWMGSKVWQDYGPSISGKLEAAHLAHRKQCKLWDDSALRDIELCRMRQMPGRRMLRRTLVKPSALPVIEVPKPLPIRPRGLDYKPEPELAIVDQRGRAVSHAPTGHGSAKLEVTFDPSGFYEEVIEDPTDGSDLAGIVKTLYHPALLQMKAPRFDFQNDPTDLRRRLFAEIVQCEDLGDELAVTAALYAEQLATGSPILPIVGTPCQTVACTCLALYASGLRPRPAPPSSAGKPIEDTMAATASPVLTQMAKLARITARMSREASAPSLTTTAAGSADDGGIRPESAPSVAGGGGHHHSGPTPSKMPLRIVYSNAEDTPKNRHLALEVLEAWDSFKRLAEEFEDGPGLVTLPKNPNVASEKGFNWITKDNELCPRLWRLRSVTNTLWKAMHITDPEALSKSVMQLKDFRRKKQSSAPLRRTFGIRTSKDPAVDIGILNEKHCRRTAVVILCSDTLPGGNIFRGRLDTPEEMACERTGLYFYVREAAKQNFENHGPPNHIPEEGCLLLRNVPVFRDTWEEGFAPYAQCTHLSGVIAMALPNLNPYASIKRAERGTPLGKNARWYELQLRRKFEMVICAADEAHAEVLVISDEGYYALRNKPSDVGVIVGGVLARSHVHFRELILSGSTEFIVSVRKGMGEKES